jgi:hypothetical protein
LGEKKGRDKQNLADGSKIAKIEWKPKKRNQIEVARPDRRVHYVVHLGRPPSKRAVEKLEPAFIKTSADDPP